VRGPLPAITPRGAEVSMEPYSEEFVRQRPGLITAESMRTLKVRARHEEKSACFFLPQISGSARSTRIKVTHRIEYEACPAVDADAESRIVRFKSAKNFLKYEAGEQVRT